MTLITRTITNNTLSPIELFVPGYDTQKPQVVIAPSATVDLFTVVTGDQLEAIQSELAKLVLNGSITVVATVDTATFNPVGGGSSGGANISLSNLSSTAVNTDIIPAANAVQNLGSNSNPFANVYTNAVYGENNLTISSNLNDLIFEADGNLVFSSQNLTQVHDPLNPQDAATKNYVDTTTANNTLSNLGSTAVNANLIPGVDATYNLGDGGIPLRWNNITSVQVNTSAIYDPSGVLRIVEIINDDPAWIFQVPPDLGGNRITSVSDPQATQDAATKNYVDSNLLPVTGGTISGNITMTSTTTGFLPPQLTTTQKNAIASPSAGLIVYDTTLNKLSVFNGTVWQTVTSA